MFCKKCGTEVPENTAFCPNCGANLTGVANDPGAQPQAETANVQGNAQNVNAQPAPGNPAPQPGNPAPQPGAANIPPASDKASGNKIVKIAVPVAAVIVVLLIVSALFKGGSSKGGSFFPVIDTKTGVMASGNYLFNMNGDYEELESRVGSNTTSADHSTLVYKTDDGLFYVKHNLKSVQITDENVDRFYINTDGSIVAYQLEESIYLFMTGKDDEKEVATELYSDSWCISPDGKYVLYQKETSKSYALYVAGWSQDEEKVAGEASPLAISDGGKYKFYSQVKDDETRLYFAAGSKEGEKIDTLGSSRIYMNKSGTEIVYSNTKSNTCYFNVKKSEPVKMAGKSLSLFVTTNTTSLGRNVTALIVDSFKGQVFYADDTLYWVNSKFEGVKIASKFDQLQLSADGKSAIYTTDKGKLMKVSGFSDNMKETELYDGDAVDDIYASSDLSKIYFITDEDELYYYTSAKKQEKLLTDTDDIDALIFNDADGKLYYVLDDELYSVEKKSGSKKKEADSIDDLGGGYQQGLKGIVYINEDGEYYYKESGKWKLVLPAE